MSKLKFSASILLLSFFCTAAMVRAVEYRDGLAAVVGNEAITVYDIVNRARPLEKSLRDRYAGDTLQAQIEKARKEIAKQMVQEKLLFMEAKKRNIKLPRKYVDERLDEIVVARAGGSYEKFREMLNQDNTTLVEYREQLTERLTARILINEFVRRQVTVTNQDVEEFYDKHRAKFGKTEAVHLRAIFLKKEGETTAALLGKAEELMRKLKDGTDFAALAKAESDDPRSAAKGGDLGWIEAHSGRQVFLDAVKALEPGEVAEPVKQPEGIYILKLVDERASESPVLDANMRRQIRNRLEQQEFQNQYNEFIDELYDKYFVKLYYKTD